MCSFPPFADLPAGAELGLSFRSFSELAAPFFFVEFLLPFAVGPFWGALFGSRTPSSPNCRIEFCEIQKHIDIDAICASANFANNLWRECEAYLVERCSV